MATIKAISMRLKSVKNIQKITKSMKMVSAAKYSRAERELKAARPMGQGPEQFYISSELGKEEKKQNRLFIAVSSDRGLCGAIHSSVVKWIKNNQAKEGEESKIVCIGDKSRSLLNRLYPEQILFVCNEVGRLPPTFLDASRIADAIIKTEYEFDVGNIVYNKFRSVVSYQSSALQFFSYDSVRKVGKIQNLEEADEETLRCFIEFTMAGMLYYAMKEGACSEQSARMTAMDNSSKNAGEMIDKLTLTYNRSRQAAITRELIEIISGASALEK